MATSQLINHMKLKIDKASDQDKIGTSDHITVQVTKLLNICRHHSHAFPSCWLSCLGRPNSSLQSSTGHGNGPLCIALCSFMVPHEVKDHTIVGTGSILHRWSQLVLGLQVFHHGLLVMISFVTGMTIVGELRAAT